MYGNYYERKNRGLKKKALTVIGIVIVSLIVIFWSMNYYSEKTYTATVTDKDIKNYDSDSKFLIFTKTEDGVTRVFSMEDTWIKGRGNTADDYADDVYAEIEVGENYTFTVIGWRIPFISEYENIIEFQKQ